MTPSLWYIVAIGISVWIALPRILFTCIWLAIAFACFLGFAMVQSLMEMSRTVHSTLLSTAASAFYFGRHRRFNLLQTGFRAESMRRIPASAYLHSTFGLDRSICDELSTLVNILVGDFVTSWYKILTSDELFTSSIKLLFCDILGGLCVRAQKSLELHGSLAVGTEVLQIVQLHLVWFRELYVDLSDEHPHVFGDDSFATLDLRRNLVHAAIQNHPKLHPGCTPGNGYIKHISTQLLIILRPDFDDKTSKKSFLTFTALALHFVSEIISNCVFNPLLSYCNPIYLNPLVAEAIAPFQVRDVDLDTKAKRPLPSYVASHTAKGEHMYDDVALVKLVSILGEIEPAIPEPILPLSPPISNFAPPTPSTKAKLAKHKKQRSLLDVGRMKARFTRRLQSTSVDRSDITSSTISNETELSKSEIEPSLGYDMVQQVDQAVQMYLNLQQSELTSSGQTKEIHALVSGLEEVLLFGFKGIGSVEKDSSYWPYLSVRRTQTSFWNDRLDLMETLPLPRISDGHFSARGVQWLLLALEEGELWEYFTAMALDSVVTEVYYEPYAVLRDKELSSLLLKALFRLNGTRVTLKLEALGNDRRSKLSSELAGTNVFGVMSVIEEAWESERYLPLQGWVKSSDKRKKEDERLPSSEWIWEGKWTLDECPEQPLLEADRGWQYSKTSKDVGFHSKESMLDCIRRRKWQRTRKLLPLVLIPVEDVPRSNQEREQVQRCRDSVVKVDVHCNLCQRHMEKASSHTCPLCVQIVCFSCSNHCVSLPSQQSKQRVCTKCYDEYVRNMRLQLVATATLVDITERGESKGPFFVLHVKTSQGQEWKGIKSWDDFQNLNTALNAISMSSNDETDEIDTGEWRRISPPPLTCVLETDTLETLVNRFLVELLKCHTLCQMTQVQRFFLDIASDNPLTEKEAKSNQTTRKGQILLQKLEIQAFKLMDELFELDEVNRMRRKLLSVTRTFFRVSFNATCHRIVEAQFADYTHPKKMASLLYDIRAMAIPTDGIYNREYPPPTSFRVQEDAKACRTAILRACPTAFVSLLGETPSRNGCLKIFEFLQHEILVKNLVFSVLDVLLNKIFPEMSLRDVSSRSKVHKTTQRN